MRDRPARILAIIALAVALTTGALTPSPASPLTEPDAAALQVRIAALEQSSSDQAQAIDELVAGDITRCLALSDSRFVRERINGRGRKWRLPIVVWNMSDKTCRP